VCVRVLHALASMVHTQQNGKRIEWPRIFMLTTALSIHRLSVKDKKGNALMVPIHRWLVRGKPTQAVEGKLRWKYVQPIHN